MIKSGDIVVDDGELRQPKIGKTLHVAPEFDVGVEDNIREWFEQYYSIRFRNYPVSESYLHDAEEIPC